MVGMAGLEPARAYAQLLLRQLRLPIPPHTLTLVPVVRLELTRPFGHLLLRQAGLPIPPYRHIMVRLEGFEPSRPFGQLSLSQPRLPFRHRRLYGAQYGICTHLRLFCRQPPNYSANRAYSGGLPWSRTRYARRFKATLYR